MEKVGWRSRGYLPHFHSRELIQSVTFRLGDSVPQEKLEAWKKDVRCTSARVLWNVVENYLDRNYGSCVLKHDDNARIVEESLLFFDATRYRMWAWCVMPNHVHALFEPLEPHDLSTILHSWKSFSSNAIHRSWGVKGSLWQVEYFDRFIRSEAHFNRALHYIEQNPVKAGLCQKPEDWPRSSARFGSTVGAQASSLHKI